LGKHKINIADFLLAVFAANDSRMLRGVPCGGARDGRVPEAVLAN